MRTVTADKLIRRLAKGTTPVRVSVGGRRKQVLLIEPARLTQFVNELRQRRILAWMSYCSDCTGVAIEGRYTILRGNTELFVFPDEDVGVPAEHLLRINVELIRGYMSLNGYVVVTGDEKAIESVMKIVDHLLDNDVILLVHKPTEPCIRVA